MSLSAGTRLGSYEVVAPLGAGGMGEVYRARHVKLRREAAIKVLPDALAADPGRLARFEHEARAASALNHPAIVTIYDIDEHQGTRYIAMELIEGITLRRRLAEGPLETREALAVAAAIAEGLARAHAAGVVHRDLKPENVMLAEDGQVKILDFGLAKQLPSGVDAATELSTMTRMTREGAIVGTVSYMSPEQAAGGAVDHHSDQFAFGVVLYEMLCGQLPFQGESVASVLSAILRDPPPLPRKLRPETPREVERIVRRCLEKEPAKRYPTTLELSEALADSAARLAGGRPGIRLGRRAVAAVVAVLVLAGAAVAWLRLRDELVRWTERETLARIDELTEAGKLAEAFGLVREVAAKLPDDPGVREKLERITVPISIATEPAGARVEVRGYAAPESPWLRLGETPLQGVRVPYALTHWRITRPGYETFEGAPFGVRPFTVFAQGIVLDPEGSRPEGTVRVPGGPYTLEGYSPVERRLAFYGFSGGALYGPVFSAIDDRFRASVLLAGGLVSGVAPEMDAVNFAPRSRVPTLMINGEHDFLTSFAKSQEPLFRILGAPADEMRHARLAGGHIPSDRLALIEEVLAWLDRFLGPVGEGRAGAG